MSSSENLAAVHDEHYDPVGTRLGFWMFLYTELFLFLAFFLLYAVYRHAYTADFVIASHLLSIPIGTTNTVILLFSSLTVVLSIVALQKGNRKASLIYIAITILCALAFLVIKSFEWSDKFHHDLFFAFKHNLDAGLGSPKLQQGDAMLPAGQIMFFGLYFVMTGIHALHIIIGGVLLLVAYFGVKNNKITQHKPGTLENFGLYWHLVDLIWIFLFPLYYLVK